MDLATKELVQPHHSDEGPYLQCEVCAEYIIAPPGGDLCICHKPASNGSGPVGLLLSEVEPERVEWLWEGRIPLGKITLIEGRPG